MLIVLLLALDQQTASEKLCPAQPNLFLNPEQKALPRSPPACLFSIRRNIWFTLILFRRKFFENSCTVNQFYAKCHDRLQMFTGSVASV